jgi:hypothetical protein
MQGGREQVFHNRVPRWTTRRAPQKIRVENVNVPGFTTQLDKGRYEAMRKALLKVLPAARPGLTQSQMVLAVQHHLPPSLFPGGAKAGWWAKAVQLDLEAKKIVTREGTKPLRWHKTPENV